MARELPEEYFLDFRDSPEFKNLLKEEHFKKLSKDLTLWKFYQCSNVIPRRVTEYKQNNLIAFTAAHYPQKTEELRDVLGNWSCGWNRYDKIQDFLAELKNV